MRRLLVPVLVIEALLILAVLAYAQNTVQLVNTRYNAEGTGNVLTLPVSHYIPAAICQNATAVTAWSTPTSDPAVAACVTGSNTQRGVLDYADSSNLSAQYQFMLPADWTSTVDVRIVWHTTATSGSVVWQLSTICVDDAETGDPAFNTASTVTDAAKGTTLQFNDAAITGLTVTGCSAGDTLFLKMQRDASHASDDLAATARLVGVELMVRRAI